MSFTEVEEKRLIKCIAKHPILYDPNHDDYRNSFEKDNVWWNVALELNKSGEDCKKKWKFIRDGYQRFKKKHNLYGFAPKNSKNNRHRQLWFLEDIPQYTRSSGANVTDSPPGQSPTTPPHLCNDERERRTSSSEPNDNNTTEDNIAEQRLKIKRIKRENNNELEYWRHKDENRQDSLRSTVKRKHDDVELFCRHIAEVLRNLPSVYKAEAKKDIGILVSNYEIKAAQLVKVPGPDRSVSPTCSDTSCPNTNDDDDD